MHLQTVSAPVEKFCAPEQMDGGLNTGFIQTDEVEDVCGTGRQKNELLKNKLVSNQ